MIIDYIPKGGGVDTSDATATASDLMPGKTAYVNDVKLTGTATSDATATAADIMPGKTAYVNGSKIEGTATSDATATAADIMPGKTAYVNGSKIEGTATSDATATANDILDGKTAYVNGSKLLGLFKTAFLSCKSLPYMFHQGGAVVYNNELHILGGSYINNVTISGSTYTVDYKRNEHYKWNGSSWTSVSTIPYPFTDGEAVIYGNAIHILGSSTSIYNSSTSSYTYYRLNHYRWNGSSWTSISTLPYWFDCGSAVVYNNEIHLLGGYGYTDSSRNSNWTKHYKWNGSSWSSVSTLPYSFYEGAAVVYNNEIHILGGGPNAACSNHYKWNGSSWTSVSTLPYKAYECAALVYDNEIHLLGGYPTTPVQRNEKISHHYKWNGTNWSEVSTLPYIYNHGKPVIFNNRINILGCGLQKNDCVRHYEWDGQSWLIVLPDSEKEKIFGIQQPIAVGSSAAFVYNDEIHLFGSRNMPTALSISNTASITPIAYNDNMTHYKWDGLAWKFVSFLPYAYYAGAIDNTDTTVYAYGGQGAMPYGSKYVMSFNKSSETWSGGGSTILPQSFAWGSGVRFKNIFYLLGGNNSTYILMGNGTSFSKRTNTLPYSFVDGAAVVYNNEVHILGSSNSTYSTYHYKASNTGLSNWSSVSTLPYKFGRGAAIVYNNEIHIMGGDGEYTSGGTLPPASLRKHYKWNGSTWTSVSTLPYPARDMCLVVYHDRIHMLGTSGNSYLTYEYCFNHYAWDGTKWEKVYYEKDMIKDILAS